MRPKARASDIVVQEVGDELLVYDLRTHNAMTLNRTSAMVWRLCDGKRTVAGIGGEMEAEVGSPVTEEFVEFALEGLAAKDLLDPIPEFRNRPDGFSRREALHRIAAATVIALPAIASIVAPPAAAAQSVDCTACVKFNTGATCGACANVVGTCYENAGCGGGQATPGITCANCFAGVGACAGGGATCSWRQV